MFQTQVVEKIKHTFYIHIHALYEIMWKSTVEPD